VTAQLIKVSDGFHLWSERYDRELADVFAIQDEIASAISAALKMKFSAEEVGRRVYTPNMPAYEAYLKARHYWMNWTSESQARSKEYAEQAIALDPGFALAHIELCEYYLAAQSFLPSREAMAAMRKEAEKALEIDPSLPEAHAMLGIVAAAYDYD
jgi:hypothetical protein